MIKYRTTRSSAKIDSIEVERETDASVWINGRRLGKMTDWYYYHDTWEEAKAYLISKAESRLNSARYQLGQAQGHMGNVKGLKK